MDELIAVLNERMINKETLIQRDANLRKERKNPSLIRNDIGYGDCDASCHFAERESDGVKGHIRERIAGFLSGLRNCHLPRPPEKQGRVNFKGRAPEIEGRLLESRSNCLGEVSYAD
jgi:hypothetical protein